MASISIKSGVIPRYPGMIDSGIAKQHFCCYGHFPVLNCFIIYPLAALPPSSSSLRSLLVCFLPAMTHQSVLSSPRVKMCEAFLRPNFKGVVVTTTSLWILFALVGSSNSVPDSGIINSIQNSEIYCVYLHKSQELRCDCQNLNFNRSQPIVFPNHDIFVSLPNNDQATLKIKEVATIKLSGCSKLHLTIDLTPLPYPFYR